MGLILLNFDYNSDVVMCPDYVSENLLKYQFEFDKWIYNRKNGYWLEVSEGDYAVYFDGSAFVKWLNQNIISDSDKKAYFVKKEIQPNIEENRLPHINF